MQIFFLKERFIIVKHLRVILYTTNMVLSDASEQRHSESNLTIMVIRDELPIYATTARPDAILLIRV